MKKTVATEIKVYLNDGRVFKYPCSSTSAREHVQAIVNTGYRRVVDKNLEHYPPHRILKVKAIGGQTTNYTDEQEGT